MDRAHLSKLILNEKRLIIPNVGAFLHKELENGKVEITFSPYLKYNDGQLEELLIKQFKYSKEEAHSLALSLSTEISNEIRNIGSFQIPNVGMLTFDSKGTLKLTPNNGSNEISTSTNDENVPERNNTPESSGKEIEFIEENIEDKNEKAVIANESFIQNDGNKQLQSEQNEVPKKQILNDDQLNIEEKQVLPNNDTITRNQPKKSSSKPLGLRILVLVSIALVVSLIIAFGIKIIISSEEEPDWEDRFVTTESVEPLAFPEDKNNDDLNAEFESLTPDETANNSNSKNEVKPQSIEDKIEESLVNNQKLLNQKVFYRLVVGSFSNAQNAKTLASKLNEQGFQANVFLRENGKHVVTIGEYASRQKAESDKRKYANKFPGIWIIKL
ncbi:SPOR domain-containing protein [Tenuifilum thalassicum]|uniref:SPOR domain-containing protein n=1 Tax=Tenuifilum thalassicum TaxID=2590900 RepID=A0A7D3XL12_9BACT|nr:SPOR domain-containing protein [Tenuifilum thalassicum]